jgi:phage tail sheath protein FI
MANYVSPGVYTIEKDISDYAPSINTSIVGVVGFASKGPTNKPTLITSQANLIRTFGAPSENIIGQGLEGSLEILEQTNSLYFVRAARDTALDASASLPLGSCPAVVVNSNSYGATGGTALYLQVQVYDNTGAAKFTQNSGAGKRFALPVGTAATQLGALQTVIGGTLDADLVGVFDLNGSGAIVGAYAGSGASIVVTSYSDSGYTTGVSALKAVLAPSAGGASYGLDDAAYGATYIVASAVTAYGQTFLSTPNTANHVSYFVESLYPGAGYNGGINDAGDTSGNSITVRSSGSQNFIVSVNQDGVAEETFNVNLTNTTSFLETAINTGATDNTSDIIKANLYQGTAGDADVTPLTLFSDKLTSLVGGSAFKSVSQWKSPVTSTTSTLDRTSSNFGDGRFIKLIETTLNLAGGTNGDDGTADQRATALIGDATEEPKTGMQSLDDPLLNIGIALVPGIHTQSVQNALITLAETTQNFIALVSPPYAVGTVQDAIDWTNGKASTTGSRTSAINSSYAAIYWPWVRVFSVFDGKDRWYDPAIFGARQMAYTDSVADSWFAPAGFRRGRLTKPSDTEVKLNQGDRDSLYSGGNVINPIVSFPQQGITIFGQRTSQRSPSALDRINVRRLMIYIRKIILASTQRFVFEPNDEFTWAEIEGVLNPFLDDIRRRRGITEFRVVCDETVNTPVRVDRNELWTKVLIKPTKTAEILIFEINLTNQSAQLGSL